MFLLHKLNLAKISRLPYTNFNQTKDFASAAKSFRFFVAFLKFLWVYYIIMKLNWQQIQEAITQLIAEYKYDPYMVLDIVKMGIRTAYRKDYMPNERKAQIHVSIGKDGTIKVYREWTVVEEIEEKEDERQKLIKEAKEIKEDVALWDSLMIDITPDPLEFTRIWVMAAAQTIKQNLKNIERERFFEKFQDKQGELLKAKVLRYVAATEQCIELHT